MIRIAFSLLLPFLVLSIASANLADDEDKIILKEGGLISGTIISDKGSTVKIKVKGGKVMYIKKKDIRKIISKPKPEQEYKKRAKETSRKDPKANYELALWCQKQGMKSEAEKHLKIVLKWDPDHEGARKALGFGFYEGKWHSGQELESMGLVPFDGEWIKKEELAEAKRIRRETYLAQLEDVALGSEEAVEAKIKSLDFTLKSFKVKGDLLYNRFQRDKTRLYVVRDPLIVPLNLPILGQEVSDFMLENEGDPVKTLEFLVDRSGGDMEEEFEPIWQPPERSGNNLAAAVVALGEAAGEPFEGDARKTIRARTEAVPAPFRDGLAKLINAYTHACLLRRQAFTDVVEEDLKDIVSREEYGAKDKRMESLDFAKEVAFWDGYPLLAEAGRELMKGAMEFAGFAKENQLKEGVARREFILRLETPFGRIVVGGKGDNYYEEPAALLVDLGGNDTYLARTGSSAAAPNAHVSLCLDFEGNDEYLSDDEDTFGSGNFGVGLCFDLDGNDTYSSLGRAFGVAYVGLGVLFDAAGDDSYECGTIGEGSALFGYGLLIDKAGKDSYSLNRYGQGFGGTYGVGLLADLDGNDTYVAGGEVLAGGDDLESTASFAQGAARGCGPSENEQPTDEARKLFISGGWGILVEGGGDDRYKGGSYVQGAARWSALGMLLDRWGDDVYEGARIAQGAGHMLASGLLCDGLGDDKYEVSGMGQGCAMILSVGMLWDYFGTDRYKGGENTLGYVRDINCLSLMVDARGNDEYEGSPTSLGFSEKYESQIEHGTKPLGLFMDLGGDDRYTGRPNTGNNKTWGQEQDVGAGEDREL